MVASSTAAALADGALEEASVAELATSVPVALAS